MPEKLRGRECTNGIVTVVASISISCDYVRADPISIVKTLSTSAVSLTMFTKKTIRSIVFKAKMNL